jgi:hypothetical protein
LRTNMRNCNIGAKAPILALYNATSIFTYHVHFSHECQHQQHSHKRQPIQSHSQGVHSLNIEQTGSCEWCQTTGVQIQKTAQHTGAK